MKTPNTEYIVSITSEVGEARFDGSIISSDQSASLTGLKRVISLNARSGEPASSQDRINRAIETLSAVGADVSVEHHIVSGEEKLSEMIDCFVAEHMTPDGTLAFDIPESSIADVPVIAHKFGVVAVKDLPGQYL